MSYKNTIKQAQDLARSIKDSDSQTRALAFGSICSLLDLAEKQAKTSLNIDDLKLELFKDCFEADGKMSHFANSLGILRI